MSQWAAPYYAAFCRLSGSRTYTMGGAGPIPVSEILAYCQLYGISSPDDIDDLVHLVGVCDGEWLKSVNKVSG